MARVQLGESRLKARRMRRRMIVAGLACVLLVAIVGGLAALSWVPAMRVKDISVSGVRAADAEMLQQAIRQELRGGYGYIFARSNIFIYPQERIEKRLEAFSTIKKALVQADTFTAIAVEVTERQPTALWCENGEAPQCYFLDETGLAYAPAAHYSGDAYQKYYGPLIVRQGSESARGQFLYPEQFRTLPPLVESLQHITGLSVRAVVVDEEGEASVVFANEFVIQFALEDELGGIVERLSLVLGAEPFSKRSLDEFKYLDLRFGDKVYYKLKEQ